MHESKINEEESSMGGGYFVCSWGRGGGEILGIVIKAVL
jgi:hypothetical protein